MLDLVYYIYIHTYIYIYIHTMYIYIYINMLPFQLLQWPINKLSQHLTFGRRLRRVANPPIFSSIKQCCWRQWMPRCSTWRPTRRPAKVSIPRRLKSGAAGRLKARNVVEHVKNTTATDVFKLSSDTPSAQNMDVSQMIEDEIWDVTY